MTLPLWVRGASCGHDLSFHLENWMEVAAQWRSGVAWPRWDTHAAWMAGEPRLLFYPPMSWLLGGTLAALLPLSVVTQSFTLIALFLSGLSMRRLAQSWLPTGEATLAGCLYLANPYMLFVAWERTAYAELLAAAWMPLLLLGILQPHVRPLRIAVPLALLWYTNAPAAVIGCYSLLLLGGLRLAFTGGWRQRMHVARQLIVGSATGLLLSAFYILPAAYERRFVQIDMATVGGMLPANNFLFGRTGEPFHDQVLHTASAIAVLLLLITVVCATLLVTRSTRPAQGSEHGGWLQRRSTGLLLGCFSVLILLLLLPVSGFVWRHGPELAFLQFPWRLLSVQAACSALLLGLVLPRTNLRVAAAGGLLLAAAAGINTDANLRQACDPEDSVAAQRSAFVSHAGSEPTDEYTPRDADNDALSRTGPDAWIAATPDAAASTSAASDRPSTQARSARHIALTTPARGTAGFLIVRLRAFPGWRASVDGVEIAAGPERDDGLLNVPLPDGRTHSIDVRYRWTADQWLGLLVAGLTGGGVLLTRRRRVGAFPSRIIDAE